MLALAEDPLWSTRVKCLEAVAAAVRGPRQPEVTAHLEKVCVGRWGFPSSKPRLEEDGLPHVDMFLFCWQTTPISFGPFPADLACWKVHYSPPPPQKLSPGLVLADLSGDDFPS